MALLDRIPPWATTGVGSLPFSAAAEAAAHAVAAYDVPFCPQLPRLEGDMTAEWLGADPRRCGWSPDRDRERPQAWDALLEALDRRPPAHGVVKLQVTGPVTLANALEGAVQRRPARRRAASELAAELASWLAANAAGQVAALAARGLETLLIVDEPALGACGERSVAHEIWDPLRMVAPAWGLHLCCAVPWELVDRAAPDVLSLDLGLVCVDRRAARSLSALIRRGGRVGWGVVAPHRPELDSQATARLVAIRALLDASGRHSLLTAACGSGLQSTGREHEIAGVLSRARDSCTAAALAG